MDEHDGLSRRRVLMVAGGTGGHIFPALAVAEELHKRGERANCSYEIEFLGTQRPLEARLIPAAGFQLRAVAAAGLKGIGVIQWLRNLLVLPRTALAVAGILREFKPQVVVGVGGYLAGPVMIEAALGGIPTILIEPNARPGLTNRLLAPVVRAAAVGFAETAHFYGMKAHITGHPVRRAFFEIPPRCHPPVAPALLPENPLPEPAAPPTFTVFVVGGSQGSRAINHAVPEGLRLVANEAGGVADLAPTLRSARNLPPENRPAGADLKVGATPLRIIHQTGEHDYNEVRRAYQERGLIAQVATFIDDMPAALAQADLVISRAGATAVAELAAVGRASILIPFPHATDQHQLQNAQAMEKVGAALVIVQADLTPERLATEIRKLWASPCTLEKMATAARRLAKPDAAARIADLVEAYVEKS